MTAKINWRGFFISREVVKEEEKIETVRSTYDASKADSEELMAIFERTYGKVTPRIGDWDVPVKKTPEREYVYKEREKKKQREEINMVKFNLDPIYLGTLVKVNKVKKVSVKLAKVRKHKILPVKFNLMPRN